MPLKPRFASACLLALLVLDARAALALAPQRFSLSWVREPGAEACSTGHRLATLVTLMLGPVLATPDEAEMAIEGSVRNDSGTWRASIAVTDRAGSVLGRRELSSASPSCAALDAQVLLVFAIAIDPEVALDGLSPELIEALAASGDVADELLAELRQHAAPATPRPAPAPEPAAKPRPAPRPAQAQRPKRDVLSLRLGTAFSLGHSPSPVFGASFGLELRPLPRWALALHGTWYAPSTTTIDEPRARSASVRFDLQTLSFAACGAPLADDTWRASACAGVALSRRAARSEGLANATHQTRLDASPQLASTLAYLALRPWSLTASAVIDIPLQRPRFYYRAPGTRTGRTLFVPAAVGLAFSITFGIEI